jgi:hypothetical protein
MASRKHAAGWLGSFLALSGLGVFGFSAVHAKERKAAEPAPHFTGDIIPDPPYQKEPWRPCKLRVPEAFVKAAKLLFEQGLADPRGCEYRQVMVAVGNGPRDEGIVVKTNAWVLPAKPGVRHRFAVGWNGLVYPLVSVGDKADLSADISAYVKRLKRKQNSESDFGWSSNEARSIWLWELGDLNTCLLLRLGEVELAERLWQANHKFDKEGAGPAAKDDDPYLILAHGWALTQFERALLAHHRGDDRLALHGFKELAAFAKVAEAEATERGFKPSELRPHFLNFLGQVPAVVADQERRARRDELKQVVCIGPGRDPDLAKRIAALIARLDQVKGPLQSPNPSEDPIVAALIREGLPAAEPLLECLEKDRRLTRSIFYWTEYPSYSPVQGVPAAASVALRAILEEANFEPPEKYRDKDQKLSEEAVRTAEADAFRTSLKKGPRPSPPERWFRTLADDKASPDEWVWAAEFLVWKGNVEHLRETIVWPDSTARSKAPLGGKAKHQMEVLRSRKDPSVSELLTRRISQVSDPDKAAQLGLSLNEWDRATARPILPALMKRCREEKDWTRFVHLTLARAEAGDRKALDEYAEWAKTLMPDTAGDSLSFLAFAPMSRYPDHPAIAKAAEWLFGNKASPWVPLLREHPNERSNAPGTELLTLTRLLAVPAFRKAVLKELANQSGEGKVEIDRNGNLSIHLDKVYGLTGNVRPGNPQIPAEGIEGTFRVCDLVAWMIGEDWESAPRCELYWPQAKRDAAVAACTEFLKRYGDRLGRSRDEISFPRLDGPASADQVRKGLTIFSLASQGEVRVVKLPAGPLPARWATLKDHPRETTEVDSQTGRKMKRIEYQQDGKVWQAEEVWRGGEWRRYFGFAGVNHLERVPAEEIEFPAVDGLFRARLTDGLDGRLEGLAKLVDPELEGVPRLPAGTAPTFALHLRNRGGLDAKVSALEGKVRLRAWYSPERVSRQGVLVPTAEREAEWIELKPKAKALKLEADRKLGPAEEYRAVTFDLRDWFEINRPGFYRVRMVASDIEEAPAAEDVRFSLAPKGDPALEK